MDTLGVEGSLLVLDRDPEAIAAAQGLMAQDPRVNAMKIPFGALGSALSELRLLGKVDGICSILVCLRRSWITRARIQFHERWSARYEDGQ